MAGSQASNQLVKDKISIPWKKLLVPAVVMLAFWGVAMWGFLASGHPRPLIMFGYIGSSLGLGLGLYAVLPKQKKPISRRLTLFMGGGFPFFVPRVVGR